MNYSENGVKKKAEALRCRSVRISKKVQVLFLRLGFLLLIGAFFYMSYLGYRYMHSMIDEVPNVKTIELVPTGKPTLILDDSGETVRTLTADDINRSYTMLDQMPRNLQNAFIAIEDSSFRSHEGIDSVGTLKAFVTGLTNGGNFSQSSTTITQQLLKNQVLTGGEEHDFASRFKRKFKELYMALSLENRYSKDEILEYYLNTIALGQNTLGVEAASMRYFNKHVSDLTLSECATLAAIAKNPVSYNPINHAARNRNRELLVLTAMQEQGLITSEEYEKAIEDNVQVRVQRYNEEYVKDKNPTSFFTDALILSVIEDLKKELGYTDTQAANAIYTGGLVIKSTQDTNMQIVCDKELNNPKNYPSNVKYQLNYQLTIEHTNGILESFNFSDMKKWYEENNKPIKSYFKSERQAHAVIAPFRHHVVTKQDTVIAESIRTIIEPQCSFVLMDQTTGEIKALVGGRGEKEESLCYNRATAATRQPGSTMSVLSAYLPALDTSGITLGNVYDDTKYNYPNTEQPVNNIYKDTYHGLTTERDAIKNSINVVAVKTLDQVTPHVGYSYLLNLGFTTLVDGYSDDTGHSYTDISLPLALGQLTKGVTNHELTGAFATIANGGVYHQPHLYTTIKDKDDNTLIDHTMSTSKRVMKESTAWLLTDTMREEVAEFDSGSVKFGNSDMVIAGKSGITTDNNDLWFVGYTPYLSAGIWCGFDGNRSQKNGNYHKLIWKNIMEKINSRYETKNSFPAPEGIISATICTKCGKLAIDNLCEDAVGGSCKRVEFFTESTVPTDSCDCHLRCRICKSSGLLAGDGCPEADVYDVVYLQKKDEAAGEGKTQDSPLIMPEYLIDSICEIHNASR